MTPDRYDFTDLVHTPKARLYEILAEVHSDLANLHAEIAYARSCEATKTGDQATIKAQRYNDEGYRDALIEKKFLLARLLDV